MLHDGQMGALEKIKTFAKSLARPWGFTLITVAVVAGIVLATCVVIRRNWPLFAPTDSTDAWAAVSAIAATVAALCTIAIASFALRGLRSIGIARDEIVHRAQREAKLCAIVRLEEIAKEIIPLNTKALDAVVSSNLQVFLGHGETVRFDPDPTDLKAARAWYDAVPAKTYVEIATFLNRLEAWSVYFTTGVADPEVAFGPIAPLLRSWVGQYYAVLLVLRSGSKKSVGNFPNLVRLYLQWSARMDAQQLDRLHKDIEGQMEQAQGRLAKSKLEDVVPKIGP